MSEPVAGISYELPYQVLLEQYVYWPWWKQLFYGRPQRPAGLIASGESFDKPEPKPKAKSKPTLAEKNAAAKEKRVKDLAKNILQNMIATANSGFTKSSYNYNHVHNDVIGDALDLLKKRGLSNLYSDKMLACVPYRLDPANLAALEKLR